MYSIKKVIDGINHNGVKEEFSLEQLKVKKEHLIFDLETFMKGKGASSGAVVLITPNQLVMTDCFVRRDNEPDYGEHGAAINAIYQAIYKNPEEVTGTYDRMWQEQVVQDGNICIQLCDGDCTSVINMPEVISQSQYLALDWLGHKVKEVYNKNKDYFNAHPMEFVAWDEVSTFNNIDGILEHVQIGENDYGFEEEKILGNSIQKYNYQLQNQHSNRR